MGLARIFQPSRSLEPGKAVGAPLFRADSVVHEEEAVGVVFLFEFGKTGVVGTPVGLLKVGLEEVAFGNVCSAVGGYGAESFMQRCTVSAALRPFARSGS